MGGVRGLGKEGEEVLGSKDDACHAIMAKRVEWRMLGEKLLCLMNDDPGFGSWNKKNEKKVYILSVRSEGFFLLMSWVLVAKKKI